MDSMISKNMYGEVVSRHELPRGFELHTTWRHSLGEVSFKVYNSSLEEALDIEVGIPLFCFDEVDCYTGDEAKDAINNVLDVLRKRLG